MKKVIATTEAPAAVGPYSQAIALGDLLFAAGQIPLDPSTGEIVGADVTAQTERVCQNIAAVLKANGIPLTDGVKAPFLPRRPPHLRRHDRRLLEVFQRAVPGAFHHPGRRPAA